MNLKLRLNMIISILLLIIIIIGSAFTIKNARKNIQAEMDSTAIIALHMLDAEILNLQALRNNNISASSIFHLDDLNNVRHLKIDFFDASGRLQDSNRSNNKQIETQPPAWFIDAMDVVAGEIPLIRRPVYIANNHIGELVVSPDISYEISEEWQTTKGILLLLTLFFFVVNLVVYFAVNLALRPIDKVLIALTDLESGDLTSRLPPFTLPELSGISDKFNIMAATLQSSTESNSHLTQQLIRLQEDERKNLAQELHDEIGQHLTAIHMDASAIKSAKNIESAQVSATAIDAVVRRMMEIVRTLLQRLRPSDLDELGLESALHTLISTWQERNPNITLNISIKGDFNHLDDTVLISAYRLVQEALTNIARYAQAQQVNIQVYKENKQITIKVSDDGQGFDLNKKTQGFGLAGMKERVEGLAGSFDLQTAINNGVKLTINLPCATKGQ